MAKITDWDKPSEKKKKSSSSKKKSLKEHIEDEDEENKIDTTHLYADNLNGDVYTETNANPKAKVHSTEWMKIMTVAEWTSRWKQNDRFPDCLACGSTNTKEHHFTQTWCRGKKKFESETICMDCHMWSWRSYVDPDFLTPEEFDKIRWEKMVKENEEARKLARAKKN